MNRELDGDLPSVGCTRTMKDIVRSTYRRIEKQPIKGNKSSRERKVRNYGMFRREVLN